MGDAKHQTHRLPNKKSSDVLAGYVKAADAKVDRIIDRLEAARQFDQRADRVAGDDRYTRNFTFTELMELAPWDNRLWSVDKYYPFAKGGPLVVEEPVMEHQIALCVEKAKLFEKLNVRYLVLLPDSDVHSDMEALQKCNGQL